MRTVSLPCPCFSICLDFPGDSGAPLDLSALPPRPGVFAFEDADGRTLALTITANLRRNVKSKLEPPPTEQGPSRRVNYRSVAQRIRALTVGSHFEADWAYLQLARPRLPDTYRMLLDRWQAWFIQCDPAARFPQFTKTAKISHHSDDTVYLGPFGDKHAAARYIELLQDAFDLCRYHHILLQAPHATACAYKEMGRCPAPCDGSISMDEYYQRLHEAIQFASTPIDQWRKRMEAQMQAASETLDFEQAQRKRQLLERTAAAAKSEFAFVDRLERFIFLAVMPAESRRAARLFLIRGGWIEPLGDLPLQPDHDEFNRALQRVRERAEIQPHDFSDEAAENIGLVCWHLFRPKAHRSRGAFFRLTEPADLGRLLQSALHSLASPKATSAEPEEPMMLEQDMESPA